MPHRGAGAPGASGPRPSAAASSSTASARPSDQLSRRSRPPARTPPAPASPHSSRRRAGEQREPGLGAPAAQRVQPAGAAARQDRDLRRGPPQGRRHAQDQPGQPGLHRCARAPAPVPAACLLACPPAASSCRAGLGAPGPRRRARLRLPSWCMHPDAAWAELVWRAEAAHKPGLHPPRHPIVCLPGEAEFLISDVMSAPNQTLELELVGGRRPAGSGRLGAAAGGAGSTTGTGGRQQAGVRPTAYTPASSRAAQPGRQRAAEAPGTRPCMRALSPLAPALCCHVPP